MRLPAFAALAASNACLYNSEFLSSLYSGGVGSPQVAPFEMALIGGFKIMMPSVSAGIVRVTVGRQRVAQHAHPQATFKPQGRATRPMRQSVSACKLGG